MWEQFFLKENIKWRWGFCLFLPLYICLFTVLLEPLKGEIVSYTYPSVYNVIGFIILLLACILCTIVLPYVLPAFFNSKNWTRTRFFVWFFLLIVVGIIVSYIFDASVNPVSNLKEWTIQYFISYMPPNVLFIALPMLAYFFMFI